MLGVGLGWMKLFCWLFVFCVWVGMWVCMRLWRLLVWCLLDVGGVCWVCSWLCSCCMIGGLLLSFCGSIWWLGCCCCCCVILVGNWLGNVGWWLCMMCWCFCVLMCWVCSGWMNCDWFGLFSWFGSWVVIGWLWYLGWCWWFVLWIVWCVWGGLVLLWWILLLFCCRLWYWVLFLWLNFLGFCCCYVVVSYVMCW